jgi:hypothetical protein
MAMNLIPTHLSYKQPEPSFELSLRDLAAKPWLPEGKYNPDYISRPTVHGLEFSGCAEGLSSIL